MNGLFGKVHVLCAAIAAFALCASASPDYTSAKYRDLYKAYSNELVEADREYTAALSSTIRKQAEDLKSRATRARISGNKVLQLDTKELKKLLEENLALLDEGKDVQLPEKVRPGNNRYLSIIRSAVTSATHAKEDTAALARMKGSDKLRKYLEADGVNVNSSADVVTRAWDEMVAEVLRTDDSPVRDRRRFVLEDNPREEELEEGEEGEPYGQRGEAVNWRRLARIEVRAEAMDTITVPLFPLKKGENKKHGRSFMGGKIPVVIKASAAYPDPPRRHVALRVRPIGGSPRIGILTWPSPANDWQFEIRVRPRGGKSLNRCILEIGER